MGIIMWWDSLDFLLQVLYCIAAPASAIFLIQIMLTLFGFGQGGEGSGLSDTSGLDMDMDLDLDLDLDVDFSQPVDAGADAGNGGETADLGALRLFSLQSVIAFLTVFSWTAIIAYHAGLSGVVSVLAGFVFGIGTMFGVAKIIQLTARLAASGNISLKNALGQTAQVYLPIPAGGAGEGKVNLTLQERFIEVNAITDGDTPIPAGAFARVVDVRSNVLVVEKE